MKIAVVASEAAPFVKTGGLGDVMQALPLALSQQKNTYVSLFIPYYSQIKYSGKWQTEFLGAFDVPLAWRREYVGISASRPAAKSSRSISSTTSTISTAAAFTALPTTVNAMPISARPSSQQ